MGGLEARRCGAGARITLPTWGSPRVGSIVLNRGLTGLFEKIAVVFCISWTGGTKAEVEAGGPSFEEERGNGVEDGGMLTSAGALLEDVATTGLWANCSCAAPINCCIKIEHTPDKEKMYISTYREATERGSNQHIYQGFWNHPKPSGSGTGTVSL